MMSHVGYLDAKIGSENNAIAETRTNIVQDKTDAVKAAELQRQIDQQPGNTAAAAQLAEIQKGRTARAQTSYGYADEYKDSDEMQLLAANYANQRGEWPQGRAFAERAVALAGSDPAKLLPALRESAKASYGMKDYAQAGADAERGLRLKRDDRDLQFIYHDSKGRGTGKAPAATAAAPAPTAAPAAPPAENPYLRSGQTALRVQDLQRYIGEADKYLKLRDRESALRAARGAEAIDAATGYQLQSQILAVFKDFSQALVSITKAIEALAGHPERQASAYAQRAGIENSKDNPQRSPADALKDADQALALDPDSARALLERGKAKKGLGDPTADADLQAALDRAPGLKANLDEFLGGATAEAAAAPEPPKTDPIRTVLNAAGGPLNLGLGLIGGLFVAFAAYVFLLAKPSSPLHYSRWLTTGRIPPPPGQTPAMPKSLDGGRYVIGRLLGEGGMGAVHEAKDTQLGRLVAVKSLHKDLQARAGESLRFVGEAKAVAALQHPNIVQVFTIIEEQDRTFIVYERIEGSTLHEVIQRDLEGLKPRLALEYARQIALALDYAHASKVIHRDLKPANVMVSKLDGKDWLKVMDFGIAKQVENSRVLMTNTIVGTPVYMAPEQEEGAVTRMSDQYSLGVTVYEMLTHRLPFNGMAAYADKRAKNYPAPSRLQPSLPPAVDAVFAKVLNPDPAKRYPRCSDFCQALEAAL